MPPEFDMQAARAMCDSEWKLELQVKDATLLPKVENLVNRANMLPAALDEIDIRNRHIASLEAESEEQAKRIAELKGAAKADESRLAEAAKKAGIGYFGCDTPDHLADRVLELGDALVEERAKYNLLFPEMWNKKDREDATALAREQLHSEGTL